MSVARRGLKLPDTLEGMFAPGSVKAGVLSGATYPAAILKNAETGATMPDPRAGMAVAVIAAALEYGTNQNHPRPFMAMTVIKHGKEWTAAFIALLKQGVAAEAALRTVGVTMAEDIQATITSWPADNSEAWAAFKGFDAGLRFTKHLLHSIKSEVVEQEGAG
jgi:hypothetical protein